jgi:lysozyme
LIGIIDLGANSAFGGSRCWLDRLTSRARGASTMKMKISNQGLAILIDREAKRNAAYLDSVGVPTIGVGHTGPEVHMGLVWTDEQVMEALRNDLDRFEQAVNGGVTQELQQHQFDALVSFAFNVGVQAFRQSTMLKRINEGNFGAAAAQFDVWHIPPEITSRRNGEREQFKGTAFAARIN